jgi:hypothetical protein
MQRGARTLSTTASCAAEPTTPCKPTTTSVAFALRSPIPVPRNLTEPWCEFCEQQISYETIDPEYGDFPFACAPGWPMTISDPPTVTLVDPETDTTLEWPYDHHYLCTGGGESPCACDADACSAIGFGQGFRDADLTLDLLMEGDQITGTVVGLGDGDGGISHPTVELRSVRLWLESGTGGSGS